MCAEYPFGNLNLSMSTFAASAQFPSLQHAHVIDEFVKMILETHTKIAANVCRKFELK